MVHPLAVACLLTVSVSKQAHSQSAHCHQKCLPTRSTEAQHWAQQPDGALCHITCNHFLACGLTDKRRKGDRNPCRITRLHCAPSRTPSAFHFRGNCRLNRANLNSTYKINLYIIFWLQQTSHNYYICCTLCYNEVQLSAGQPFLNTVNCGCGWADIRYSGFFNCEHCNCETVVHAARLPHIVEPTYRFPPLFNITKIGVCHCLSLQMRHHWLWQVHGLFLVESF